jgi:hypothetical protein
LSSRSPLSKKIQTKRSLLIHLALWGGIGLLAFVIFSNPMPVMLVWMAWLILVWLRHAMMVGKATRRRTERAIQRTGASQKSTERSLPAELRSVLATLRSAAPAALDLERLSKAAVTLVGRRESLESSAEPGIRARLEKELDEARSQRDAQEDPVSQQALEEQIEAIEDRLASMSAATTIATRLRARERTLLHQLEDLRLTLLRQESAVSENLEGAEQMLQQLHGELEAEIEVEEALSRARVEAKARLRTVPG